MDDFSDIMGLPHHVSVKRRRMPLADRAAQFSAFAALTGYDEEIRETARLTDVRAELSEDALAALDTAFQQLLNAGSEHPAVTLTYFQPDARKEGGRYAVYTGLFRHYDAADRVLYFLDGTAVPEQSIRSMAVQTG